MYSENSDPKCTKYGENWAVCSECTGVCTHHPCGMSILVRPRVLRHSSHYEWGKLSEASWGKLRQVKYVWQTSTCRTFWNGQTKYRSFIYVQVSSCICFNKQQLYLFQLSKLQFAVWYCKIMTERTKYTVRCSNTAVSVQLYSCRISVEGRTSQPVSY